MRVLLIDVNCKYSSTGKIVYDLFQYINATDDEAAVCYGRGEVINEPGIYKFGLDLETKLHAFLTRITGLTGCFSFFSTKRLIDYIEKFKPDVVHIHELHGYFVNIKSLISYLNKKKIPIVWTFHCEFMYTGKCGVAYDCTRYTKGCGKCPYLKSYPKTLFFDFTHLMWKQKKKIFDDTKSIIIATPSVWLANRTKLSFLKNKRIEIIHNGIDTSVFKPCISPDDIKQQYGIKEDKLVLSVASHIMSDCNKGARHILKAADALKNKNIHFMIVGSEDSEIVQKGNVTILPAIRDQQFLARLYSAADAFLICSEKENFPTTCIEAQCCGTPVCGFDVGGVRETVVGNACLCEYGDFDGLIVGIQKVLSNPEYDAEKAIKVFRKEKMLCMYKELYSEIM